MTECSYLDQIPILFKDTNETQQQKIGFIKKKAEKIYPQQNINFQLKLSKDEQDWYDHYIAICKDERQLKSDDKKQNIIPDKFRSKITNENIHQFDPLQHVSFMITEMLNKSTDNNQMLELFSRMICDIKCDERIQQSMYLQIFDTFLIMQYEKACIEKKFIQVYAQTLVDIVQIDKLLKVAVKIFKDRSVSKFIQIITNSKQNKIEEESEKLRQHVRDYLITRIATELKNGKPSNSIYNIEKATSDQDKNIIQNNITIYLAGSIQYISILYQINKNVQLVTEYNFLSSLILVLKTQLNTIKEANQNKDIEFCLAKDLKTQQDVDKQVNKIKEFLHNCENSQDSTLLIKNIMAAIALNHDVFTNKDSQKTNYLKEYLIQVIQNIDDKFLDSYLIYKRQEMLIKINQDSSQQLQEVNKQQIYNLKTISNVKIRSMSISEIIDYMLQHNLKQLLYYLFMCDDKTEFQVILQGFVIKIDNPIFSTVFKACFEGKILNNFMGNFSQIYKDANNKQKTILYQYIAIQTLNQYNKSIKNNSDYQDNMKQLQSCMKFINKCLTQDKDKSLISLITMLQTQGKQNQSSTPTTYNFVKSLLQYLIQNSFEQVVSEDLNDLVDDQIINKTIKLIQNHQYYQAQTQPEIRKAYKFIESPSALSFTENLPDKIKDQMLTPFDKQVIDQLRKIFSIDIHTDYSKQLTFKQIFKYVVAQKEEKNCQILEAGKILDYGGIIHVVPCYDLPTEKLDNAYRLQVYKIEYMMYQLYTNNKKEFKQKLINLFKQQIKQKQFSYYQFLELLWTYVLDVNYAKELISYLKILDKNVVLQCIKTMEQYKEMYGNITNLYQQIEKAH